MHIPCSVVAAVAGDEDIMSRAGLRTRTARLTAVSTLHALSSLLRGPCAPGVVAALQAAGPAGFVVPPNPAGTSPTSSPHTSPIGRPRAGSPGGASRKVLQLYDQVRVAATALGSWKAVAGSCRQ